MYQIVVKIKQPLQYMSIYTAKNSFSRYPSVTQIISYLLFVMQILLFYIVLQKHLDPHWKRITMLVIYSISIAVHLIITLMISLSDPTDEFMINCINDPQHTKFSDLKGLLYCQICKNFVNKSSRHCKICSRCVQKFDHHCIWINNCVGSKNYKIFILLLLTTFSSMVVYIGSISTLWVQGAYEEYLIEMGFLWGSMLIVCIFLILITNLMLFHVYMKYLGLTTYEFIISNKGKKRIGMSKSSNKIQNNEAKRQVKMEEEEIENTQQNLPHYDNIQYNNANTNENTRVLKQINEQQKSQSMQSQNDQPSQHYTNKTLDKENSISSKYAYHYPSQLVHQNDSQNKRVGQVKNNKDNIFEQDSQGQQKDVSMRESVRFTEYFSQSKSLKLLMNSDAIKPQKLKKQHLFSSISEINNKAPKANSLYLSKSPKRNN